MKINNNESVTCANKDQTILQEICANMDVEV